MKAVNVTELKAHLSAYLRKASRGARIIVHDRDQPVAQLGPLETRAPGWRERLAAQGRLRPGSQAWSRLAISARTRSTDVQRALREVREDPRDAEPVR
jgi:antitoxin (DNA-binding transcriptional repressor) of toxin-antitoxin stability system